MSMSKTNSNGGEKQTEVKTLSLVKGGQHYCFRYEVGDEALQEVTPTDLAMEPAHV